MPPRISDSELEVMRILWREGRALSFTEIRQELTRTTKWSKSTIQTMVFRLRDKGIIGTHTHHVHMYTPLVTQEEYMRGEEQSFLDRLFDGSAKKLVAALCKSGQLAENDIDELKGFFKLEGDA